MGSNFVTIELRLAAKFPTAFGDPGNEGELNIGFGGGVGGTLEGEGVSGPFESFGVAN